jgi:hypothetical protein
LIIAIWLIVPTIALGLTLAFYKFNNKPFIFLLEALFRYTLKSKLYLWRKAPESPPTATKSNIKVQSPANPPLALPKLSESKLKELAWSLDISKQQSGQAREPR